MNVVATMSCKMDAILHTLQNLTAAIANGSHNEGGSVVPGPVAERAVTGKSIYYDSVKVQPTYTPIRQENKDRLSVLIQNLDTMDNLYIGFDSNLDLDNGIMIPPGGTYDTDKYYGAIYGMTDGTAPIDIRFVEENVDTQ